MLKLSDNPPVVWPAVEPLKQWTGRWWVGHTKSRFEKAFAWDLLRREISYFLPMIERVRVFGGKKRRVMTPLFGSYVFFCGTEKDRYDALMTHRLCQTLEVADQASLARELGHIERALQGKAQLDPYPHLALGERCRVRAGPFMGVEGVIVRRDKLCRVVLQVSLLGQGAAMEIDADLLEATD